MSYRIILSNYTGSEAYAAALIYYNSVKAAAKNNISNSQTIYEDLNKRFANSGRRKSKQDDSIAA